MEGNEFDEAAAQEQRKVARRRNSKFTFVAAVAVLGTFLLVPSANFGASVKSSTAHLDRASQAALATARAQAQQAEAAATRLAAVPVAAAPEICLAMQAVEARLIATIQTLINAVPQLATQLNAVLRSALASIDALLARLGCSIPSTTTNVPT